MQPIVERSLSSSDLNCLFSVGASAGEAFSSVVLAQDASRAPRRLLGMSPMSRALVHGSECMGLGSENGRKRCLWRAGRKSLASIALHRQRLAMSRALG